ncbi:hypothetical protein SteCoe_32707 [Stentor coeruleus]|uniref:FYVE-type domain-containing protein n=1 Tax=Stentor coeruleus TaxID=5963 RepID=A0A1R2AYH8_9CILI|nr:hypothetical protein SteCoe_32707 [Stentor coeruleus]
MDSDYSDTESVNSTISESMQTTDLFEYIDLGKDKIAYKKDKNCIICQAKFGKVGIVHARKHYCKFCYRGVCAKCSPQVAVHPVERKKLRVCNNCCQKAVINKYTEQFRMDIDHVKLQQDSVNEEIQKILSERAKIKEDTENLENLIESEQAKELTYIQLKKSNHELEKKLESKKVQNEKLMKEHKLKKTELDSQDKNYQKLVAVIENLKETIKSCKEECVKLNNELAEKQDEKISIKKQIEERIAKISENQKSKEDFNKIEKVKAELNGLQIQVEKEMTEKNGMIKEISELRDENDALSFKLKVAKEKVVNEDDKLVAGTSHEYSAEEEEKFNDLKNRRKDNQAKLENLKIELKKTEPKAIDPLDYEMTAADKPRPCARCIIS